MRKLPTGIQSFHKMRDGGYAHMDKTFYVHELVRLSIPHFLNRPHRSGKCPLLSALRTHFEGHTALFRGLAINDSRKSLSAWRP